MQNSKTNYQLLTDAEIKSIEQFPIKPKLLLHSCCAPCSSYVLEYLSKYFDITVFYYNPNIDTETEYNFRSNEQQRFVKELFPNTKFISMPYNPKEFYCAVKGLENLGEGSERCINCFKLRLEKTSKYAKENHFDYFTTTLSISPLKNAEVLNNIGYELSKKYDVKYLYSDFKKKGGYLRSVQLSKKYNIYRQDYCGCIYSKLERQKLKNDKTDI
ncbi:MAG: epoxyqueuosine reductase QueH [Christensenellaceae bacterium]|nr:epoxyqueuosine reductase QueH [Christensenellaceae bacterium]